MPRGFPAAFARIGVETRTHYRTRGAGFAEFKTIGSYQTRMSSFIDEGSPATLYVPARRGTHFRPLPGARLRPGRHDLLGLDRRPHRRTREAATTCAGRRPSPGGNVRHLRDAAPRPEQHCPWSRRPMRRSLQVRPIFRPPSRNSCAPSGVKCIAVRKSSTP